eukprot:TRINITY_DN33653_c0_g1_i1.p1 TRINITY_DN33653_c0_g1~~TRINITY_DN33653_c0_g1_i1.p1  ORF type:complete len:171 (-),score=14.68 TRINITY_DN33653_c0_g1_i1:556-1068(-)
MAASINLLFLLCTFTLLAITPCLTDAAAYDELEKYGLPAGLLPRTVLDYTLNAKDGSFVVHLSGECYSSVNGGKIPVYYAPTLTGTVQQGKLSNLKGISVKPPQTYFVWYSVNTIYVDASDSALIHFVIAFGAEQSLPTTEFSSPLQCTGSSSSFLESVSGWFSKAIKSM